MKKEEQAKGQRDVPGRALARIKAQARERRQQCGLGPQGWGWRGGCWWVKPRGWPFPCNKGDSEEYRGGDEATGRLGRAAGTAGGNEQAGFAAFEAMQTAEWRSGAVRDRNAGDRKLGPPSGAEVNHALSDVH